MTQIAEGMSTHFYSEWINCRLFQAAAVFLVFSSTAFGQPEPATPTVSPATPEEITTEWVEAELVKIDELIVSAQAAASTETAQKLGIPLENLVVRVDRLQQLKSTLQRFPPFIARLQELKEERDNLDQLRRKFREEGPEGEPPYGIRRLDQLQEEMENAQQVFNRATSVLESQKKALDQTRDRLSNAESALRTSREALKNTTDPVKRVQQEFLVSGDELNSRLWETTLRLDRLTERASQAETDLRREQVELLKEQVALVEQGVLFRQEELNEILAEIDFRLQSLQSQRETVQNKLALAEREFQRAKNAFEQARREEEKTARGLQRDLRALEVENQERAKELLNRLPLVLENLKKIWEGRFAFLRGDSQKSPAALESEIKTVLTSLEIEEADIEARLSSLTRRVGNLHTEKTDANLTDLARENINAKIALLNERQNAFLEFQSEVENLRDLSNRFLEEIEDKKGTFQLEDYLRNAGSLVSRVWNHELYSIGDEQVTVKKVSIAVFIIILGLWFSRRVTKSFNRRVLTQLRLDANIAAAIQKAIYYLLLLFVLLFALRVVNIPLGLFAFLGGALAIGFGFGAQNILNNFISGVILMVERPIKIGDLVEVEGTFGVVEEIGARSTRLKTPRNIHLLLPNSMLLENPVVNWTLSDQQIRFSVAVGVAYGSPVRDVMKLLRKAVDEHNLVDKYPEPLVLFQDFGDSALNFEVLFWVTISDLKNIFIIQSDLRRRIDRFFKDAGITIAFPQRDVHLDSEKPIRVRIDDTRDEEESLEAPKAASQ